MGPIRPANTRSSRRSKIFVAATRSCMRSRSTRRRRAETRVNPEALREITSLTGGYTEVVRTAADLGPATARIADELNKRYTLGYSSPRPPDGTWRAIRVRVRNREFFRARPPRLLRESAVRAAPPMRCRCPHPGPCSFTTSFAPLGAVWISGLWALSSGPRSIEIAASVTRPARKLHRLACKLLSGASRPGGRNLHRAGCGCDRSFPPSVSSPGRRLA